MNAKHSITAAACAVLIAGLVITGCAPGATAAGTTNGAGNTANGTTANGTTANGTTARTTTTGSTVNGYIVGGLYKRPIRGTCYVWPYVGTLRSVIPDLQTAIASTDSFGYGSSEAISANMAVYTAMDGLAGDLHTLTRQWGTTIFDDVVTPGQTGDPVRMNSAVSSAESLANQISLLCYIEP
jgi:hypothetical protein